MTTQQAIFHCAGCGIALTASWIEAPDGTRRCTGCDASCDSAGPERSAPAVHDAADMCHE